MARAVSGTICWPTGYPAACTGSNGSCANRVCEQGRGDAGFPRIMANGRSLPAMCWIASSRPTGRTRSGSPLHLYLNGRRMALRCGGDRPVRAPGIRMVDERYHDSPARHRRADHGDLAARQARCPPASLGSGQPRRIQPVVATPAAYCRARKWSRTSAGVFHPSVFRGRVFMA